MEHEPLCQKLESSGLEIGRDAAIIIRELSIALRQMSNLAHIQPPPRPKFLGTVDDPHPAQRAHQRRKPKVD